MGKGISLTGVCSPCKGCTKRFLGCHSTCLDYKAFVEKNEERKMIQHECNLNYWESQKTFQKISTETTWRKRV